MDYRSIPKEMKMLNQWVCCWESSKVPMQATVQKGASVTDPSTWSDYITALKAVLTGQYDYLGFVFKEGIVGIDIDDGYAEDGHTWSETAVDIINKVKGWVEESRSGRGFHIYTKGHLPFTGMNNKKGVEIYESGRFFIVTAKCPLFGSPILPEDQYGIDYVLENYFTTDVEKAVKTDSEAFYKVQYSKPVGNRISLKPTYPPAPKGTRNHSMASLAGQLHSRGMDKREIYLEVSRANQIACEPPLTDKEIRHIVTSICKYGRR